MSHVSCFASGSSSLYSSLLLNSELELSSKKLSFGSTMSIPEVLAIGVSVEFLPQISSCKDLIVCVTYIGSNMKKKILV